LLVIHSGEASLEVISLIKIFLKNSVVDKNTSNSLCKKKQSTLMFLRAPKHFKAGKQFIRYFKNTKKITHHPFSLNTKSFIFLSSKQLYSLYFTYILKNSLPEFKINRVTYKFKLVVSLQRGWCFIF
jgi:hypothetical protein